MQLHDYGHQGHCNSKNPFQYNVNIRYDMIYIYIYIYIYIRGQQKTDSNFVINKILNTVFFNSRRCKHSFTFTVWHITHA